MTWVDTVRPVLQHWLLTVLMAVVFSAGLFAYLDAAPPSYTSESTQYFSLSADQSSGSLAQGSTYVQDQMASYGQLAKSSFVLQQVIDELDLDMTPKQLARSVDVTTPRDTVVMHIAVTTGLASLSAEIANEIGVKLQPALNSIASDDADQQPLVVRSIQSATPALATSSSSRARHAAASALGGLLLSMLVVVVATRLDPRVRSARTVSTLSSQPVLGSIRHDRGLQTQLLGSATEGRSADDFRRLRARLMLGARPDEARVIAITSSIRAEGRTTVAANLARALSEGGSSVALVELDLRHPGLGDLVDEDCLDLVSAANARPSELRKLEAPPHRRWVVLVPAEVDETNLPPRFLSSPGLASLLARLHDDFSFVLLDTPGVLSHSDVLSLGPVIDEVLVVVNTRRARRAQVQATLEQLESTGLDVRGFVLNKVRPATQAAAPTTRDGHAPTAAQ